MYIQTQKKVGSTVDSRSGANSFIPQKFQIASQRVCGEVLICSRSVRICARAKQSLRGQGHLIKNQDSHLLRKVDGEKLHSAAGGGWIMFFSSGIRGINIISAAVVCINLNYTERASFFQVSCRGYLLFAIIKKKETQLNAGKKISTEIFRFGCLRKRQFVWILLQQSSVHCVRKLENCDLCPLHSIIKLARLHFPRKLGQTFLLSQKNPSLPF